MELESSVAYSLGYTPDISDLTLQLLLLHLATEFQGRRNPVGKLHSIYLHCKLSPSVKI